MIVVILSLIYIGILTMGFGALIIKGLDKIIISKEYTIFEYIIVGIVSITVYAQYLSIFFKIGAIAHILMLILSFLGFYLKKNEIKKVLDNSFKILFSWEGFFYVGYVILIAFFASRGTFHTDTNIYHAGAIRILEEYGLIKGIGNLQLHYAYNSSYLAYAAIFSMNWLFGKSIHTTTAFFEVAMSIYAFYGLKRYKEHKYHIADMVKVGIIFYVLIIVTGSMSPATDYTTMLMAMIVISLWCDNMENNRSIHTYAMLSVLAVYVVSMKFSAALSVIIVVYPLSMLIKEKRYMDILKYLLMGIIVILPFLVRNYYISGWLLYPFDKIDIFNVEWKIPVEYLKYDAAQIKVWGKCLYDVEKLDAPLREWLPVWWEAKERHQIMLCYGIVLGLILSVVQIISIFLKKEKICLEYLTIMVSIVGSLAVWFFMSPFIRYGRAYILAIIFMPIGVYLSSEHKGLKAILNGVMIFMIIASTMPYFDNYILETSVFIKHNLKEPYYIVQKDYDDTLTGSIDINGNTIYYCDEGEINSYHYFPNTCYKNMLERTTLMGKNIKEGFKAR